MCGLPSAGATRSQLWGKDAPDYMPGDRLIAKMPVFRPNPHKTSQKNQWQIVINNSEECEVVGKATIGVDRTHQWEYWEVPVLAASRIKITLRILTPDSEEQRLEYLKELRKDRNWKKYYYWLKLYDNVPYSYAITTHKSQVYIKKLFVSFKELMSQNCMSSTIL